MEQSDRRCFSRLAAVLDYPCLTKCWLLGNRIAYFNTRKMVINAVDNDSLVDLLPKA